MQQKRSDGGREEKIEERLAASWGQQGRIRTEVSRRGDRRKKRKKREMGGGRDLGK